MSLLPPKALPPEIVVRPRLVLRCYAPALASAIAEAVRESCTPEFQRFAPWSSPAYEAADAAQFIAQSLADWQTGEAYNYGIFEADSQTFVGGIGLNQPSRAHGFYNLGYWVRRSRQRQGVATAATRGLARAAFAVLPGLGRLELLVLPDNLPSQRTALAAGAVREGLLRERLVLGGQRYDACLFSLTRPDVAAWPAPDFL